MWRKFIAKKRSPKLKLSPRGLHLFRRYVLHYCHDPMYRFAARFNAASGVQLFERTGRRYLRKMNMQGYIAIQKPFLSKNNIAARITCANTHQHWNQEQWSYVIFTDESCFFRCVRRRTGYKYDGIANSACIKNSWCLLLNLAIKLSLFGVYFRGKNAPH